MTRGLNPPNTLSAEDLHTLRGVRRDIYSQAIIGGGLGLCSGVVMCTGAQWAKKLGFIKGKGLNRNTGMLVVLSSFAFGQFFMASTTGKELVHLLHPVFQSLRGDSSSAQEQNSNHSEPPASVDPQRLRDMRLARRKSLMETLYREKGGISDSHSGRWVEENSKTKFEKEY